MQTKLISGESAFDELAAEWDELAAQSMTNTPFQSLAYQRAWQRHLQPEGSQLTTIAIRQDSGKLTAVACLYIMLDGVIHFNGCVEETDYLDLICAAENAEAAWTAVLNALCTPEYPHWTTLDLCNIPADSPTRTILPRLAQKHNLAFHETIHEVCPIIALPATFDDYLNSLDSKQRREVRRKLRRAAGADVAITSVGHEDNVAEAVNDFLELLQKSTYEKRDWLNDDRRAVFHDTAKAALEARTLQLLFAEVEGQKAAALFNFDYDGRIWVYNSGLDPAAFGPLSLGVVLTAKAIEKAIEDGRTHFDFLRGNETYKYRFGAKDTEIYRLQASR
ncbi:MAG: GNAT family N-acetyltransferase [Chloroflexi bacterium]|nr:GNAT family N-acetyltransferase [Chloroflexota bacterium]